MFRIIFAIIFIFSGLFSYWIFRPDIYLFDLLQLTGFNAVIPDTEFLFLVKNHFADTVWCISIYLITSYLRDLKYPRLYITILLILPFLSEILQGMGYINGTFDWIDILIYLSLLMIFSIKTFHMKKLKLHIVGSAIIAFFFFGLIGSGSSKPITYNEGTFVLQPKQDDIFTKPSLSKILKTPGSTSVVLRVPASEEDKITEAQKQINNTIYSTIEKEFAKANYIVRDRALFAKVLEGENNSANYSGINESTETDLILELVSYDNIKHNTNKYTDENGNEQAASVNFSLTGTSAEFKLISVKDNDLVGSYTFYYTPCVDGCKYKFNSSGTSNKLYLPDANIKDSPYEYVAPDVLENFFKECSLRLIKELKTKQ